jgi:hypothetical protein
MGRVARCIVPTLLLAAPLAAAPAMTPTTTIADDQVYDLKDPGISYDSLRDE